MPREQEPDENQEQEPNTKKPQEPNTKRGDSDDDSQEPNTN